MEWITCLKKTLEYIEENLENDIDIEKIAGEVYVSPFYLRKGFGIITGCSIGEYIRNRRLYEAAEDICRSDEKIIDVALKYGYETPESFTKAFTRFHGASPAAVRKNRGLIRTFLPFNIKIEITGGSRMDCKITPLWGFKVIGFEKVFSYEEAYKEIPKFWDEICEKYCKGIYSGKAPSCPEEQAIMDNCIGEYGVCIDNMCNGKFRYLVAGKYTGGAVPESMTLFEFPQSDWAIFNCKGPVPEALQNLNTRVFKEWLPGNTEYEMAGYYNVEWYSCAGNKEDADYESAIWVPVRKYKDEAEKKWGGTAEFAESEKRISERSDKENADVNEGLMEIFARFGKIKDENPCGEKAQTMVAELQKYISDNFYPCTKEVLSCLGQMYVGDSRFKANIDRKGGAGTAEFASKAIEKFAE